MQKHYNYLNIDLDKKIHTKLKAKQGDSKSRYILVNLISNSTYYDLTGTTVKIYGIKKDKTIFFNNATVTNAKQGQFEIELTTQALAVPGEIEIQILILGTNQEKLTTFSFFINVNKTIVDDAAIESTNEFTALTEALSSVQNIDNRFREVDEQFNTIIIELNEDFSNLESNKNFCLKANKTYFINSTKHFYNIQNVKIDGKNATINVEPGITCFNFDKLCSDIELMNINFISDNTSLETVALTFKSEDGNYFKNSACKNIKISNCKFLGGFSASIVANVVTGLTVKNCYFTNNKYLGLEKGTGGYGILTQTCYDVKIYNNKFISTITDRHAIYISCFTLSPHVEQQNENIYIYNNFIDWLQVDAGSKHENAISIRSTKNCHVYDNTILGGWGSIAINPSHGNCNGIKIHHNICKYIKGSTDFDLFGIGSIKSDTEYNYKCFNIEISNNYITSDGKRTSPITIIDTDNFVITNNNCYHTSTGGTIIVADSNYGIISSNMLNGDKLQSYGLAFRGTKNSDITINGNKYSNVYKNEVIQDNSTLSYINHLDTRYFTVDTNGSGSVGVLNDDFSIVEKVEGIENGCLITLSQLATNKLPINVTYSFGDVPITRIDRVDDNKIKVVMRNTNGDNISCLTSALTFNVYVG